MSYSREEIPREKIEEAINNSNSMIAASRYLGVSRDRFNRYAKKYGLFNPNQPGSYASMRNELDKKYNSSKCFQSSTSYGFKPGYTTKGLSDVCWGCSTF